MPIQQGRGGRGSGGCESPQGRVAPPCICLSLLTRGITGIVVTSVRLGKVFAVKFNGLVFDRLGGGVNGRFLFLFFDRKEQGGGLSIARVEPHVAPLRLTSIESPRGLP